MKQSSNDDVPCGQGVQTCSKQVTHRWRHPQHDPLAIQKAIQELKANKQHG